MDQFGTLLSGNTIFIDIISPTAHKKIRTEKKPDTKTHSTDRLDEKWMRPKVHGTKNGADWLHSMRAQLNRTKIASVFMQFVDAQQAAASEINHPNEQFSLAIVSFGW